MEPAGDSSARAAATEAPPPPAFAQGVGTVFQFAGVGLFVAMMFVCCGSGLLSREWATGGGFAREGWRLWSDSPARPAYSLRDAMTLSVTCGVFFGAALAGVGLGLQAQRPSAAVGAVLVTGTGAVFWIVQAAFAVQHIESVLLIACGAGLAALFIVLTGFAFAAWRDMRRDPPPAGQEVLPKDYKVPYSHYHPDPPEVRLAAELAQRRERLAVQQKEVELLEEKLRRRLQPPQQ